MCHFLRRSHASCSGSSPGGWSREPCAEQCGSTGKIGQGGGREGGRGGKGEREEGGGRREDERQRGREGERVRERKREREREWKRERERVREKGEKRTRGKESRAVHVPIPTCTCAIFPRIEDTCNRSWPCLEAGGKSIVIQ